MSDIVGNPEDRFSRNAAHISVIVIAKVLKTLVCKVTCCLIQYFLSVFVLQGCNNIRICDIIIGCISKCSKDVQCI